jgi:hypothetical protein
MTDTTDPFVPPAAEGLPLAALDSATEGADRLDASARTPYGRNLLAHALVQLDRDGWLCPAPAAAPSAPARCTTPCVACMTDESHDAAPPSVPAVLREAADRLSMDWGGPDHADAIDEARTQLRRVADEAQQPEDEPTESVLYEVVGDWGVDSADSAEGARAAVAKWLRAYPKCGAYAQQRIYREWPDGSEFYGPWTDLPDPAAEARQADTAGEQQ